MAQNIYYIYSNKIYYASNQNIKNTLSPIDINNAQIFKPTSLLFGSDQSSKIIVTFNIGTNHESHV